MVLVGAGVLVWPGTLSWDQPRDSPRRSVKDLQFHPESKCMPVKFLDKVDISLLVTKICWSRLVEWNGAGLSPKSLDF